jgi:hypothetical protein
MRGFVWYSGLEAGAERRKTKSQTICLVSVLRLWSAKEDNDGNTQRRVDKMDVVVSSVSLLELAPYEAGREARHAVPGTSTAFSREQ